MVVLPSFPRASAKNDLVIIEYEDGKKYVWGSEGTPENANNVAEQLDVELKLLSYIQETSDVFLTNIYDSLTSTADNTIIYELLVETLEQWIKKHRIN